MSNKTKTTETKAKKENLEALPLPELWARFKEATGESTKSPNKRFIVRRIEEALAVRASLPAAPEPALVEQTARPRSDAGTKSPKPAMTTTLSAPPKQRGRFASMTIEELQAKYLDVVQRPTSSVARSYLVWKIREAEKGRIPVGPRKTRARDGEPLDVKILPVRLEATLVERMDDAWRTRGIKNRMEFFRRALGHYLTHLGAEDVAALLAADAQVPS